VGFAVLINELGRIEREINHSLGGPTDSGTRSSKEGESFFAYLIREHSDKITERIDKFTVKQLLLIVSGFGSYFIDRKAVQNSSLEFNEILLAIAK